MYFKISASPNESVAVLVLDAGAAGTAGLLDDDDSGGASPDFTAVDGLSAVVGLGAVVGFGEVIFGLGDVTFGLGNGFGGFLGFLVVSIRSWSKFSSTLL